MSGVKIIFFLSSLFCFNDTLHAAFYGWDGKEFSQCDQEFVAEFDRGQVEAVLGSETQESIWDWVSEHAYKKIHTIHIQRFIASLRPEYYQNYFLKHYYNKVFQEWKKFISSFFRYCSDEDKVSYLMFFLQDLMIKLDLDFVFAEAKKSIQARQRLKYKSKKDGDEKEQKIPERAWFEKHLPEDLTPEDIIKCITQLKPDISKNIRNVVLKEWEGLYHFLEILPLDNRLEVIINFIVHFVGENQESIFVKKFDSMKLET